MTADENEKRYEINPEVSAQEAQDSIPEQLSNTLPIPPQPTISESHRNRNPSLSERIIPPPAEENETSPHFFLSYRFVVGLMLAFAFFCSTSMRADLGMAMVCMVNSTAYSVPNSPNSSATSDIPDTCQATNTSGELVNGGYDGHLLWTPTMQSTLFSATYYGGLLTVLPGGILADRFSPKVILMLAIADYVIMSSLTPLIANANYYAFFAARVFMGLGEGLVLPTMSSLAARWFPATERSTIAAIYTSGNQVATSSIAIIGARLCSADFLGGWPSIFYMLGVIGAVWIVVWFVFVSSSPDQSKWISNRERMFLSKCITSSGKKLAHGSIPWLAIALSPAMIADLLSTFAANYTATMMQAFLPTFYKDVLLVDLHKNGWFTTAPFLTQLVAKNIMGIISDTLKKSGVISSTTACKAFQVAGCILQASTLFVIAFLVDCTMPGLAVAMLVVQAIGAAAVTPGSMTSLISLAPAFTGTLISLSMVAGQIANISAPSVVAVIKKKGTRQEWSTIFLVAGAMNVVAGIAFLIFGSAEEQPWAYSQSTVEDGHKMSAFETVKEMAMKKRKQESRRLSDISACELH